MADLSSLFQVAPYAGSYIAGDMLGQQANTEDARRQEILQLIQQRIAQEQRNAAREPLELERLGLTNDTTRAQLPGLAADSRKKGLEADLKAGTLQSDIDKGNASNYNEVFKMVAPQFGVIGKEISGVDALQQPLALHEALKRRGLSDEQAQQFVRYFAANNRGDLPKHLSIIGDAYLRANPEYTREITKQGMANEAHIKGIGMQVQGSKDVANIHEAGATAREGQRQANKKIDTDNLIMTADLEAKGKPPATQLLVYKKWYDVAVAKGDTDGAKALLDRATSAKETVENLPNAVPTPGAPDIAGATRGKVPVNPPARVPLQPLPGASAVNPDANALAGAREQLAAITKGLAAAGQKYEPDKYEYRLGPNGTVQRKPKGK